MKQLPIIFLLFLFFLNTGLAQNKLSGTVLDQTTDAPLKDVHLYIPSLQKGTVTDHKGHFIIKNIPDGKFRVQFSHISYKTQVRQISFAEKDTLKLIMQLDPTVIQSEEVVVSAGSYSTQHENAIKIERLDARDIQQSAAPGIMEKLTQIPGVDIISKGNAVTKPVIRGMSNSNILVMNNGIKMENFQFSENHPYLISEYGTGRVEVIKGPASLLYGSDAVGGILNFIREKPADEGTLKLDFNQKYHTNSKGLGTNIGIKQTGENLNWGLRGGMKRHQDFTSGAGNQVSNSRFNMYNVQAFTGINRNIGSFRLYYDYNAMQLGMTVPPVEQHITDNGYNNEVWYQNLDNHLLALKNTLYLGELKVNINGHWQQNHRRLTTVDMQPVDMLLNNAGAKLQAHYDFDGNSEIIAGLQANRKTNENGQAPNHVLPDHTVNDLAFFGLWQMQLDNGLRTQVGVRGDRREVDVPRQKRTGIPDDDTYIEPLSKTYSNVSFSAGATYRISEELLLRGNIASAYRTPNTAELTQQGVHGNRFERGNRNLQSQTNYEGDLSIHYHCCHWMLDVSGFYNHIDKYIYLAPTGNVTSGDLQIYEYNQHNARLYGGEFQFRIKPQPWISNYITYTKIIGKQQNGDYLPFIPHDKLKSGITITAGSKKRIKNPNVELNATYAFSQNNPSKFERTTEGYFLLNAGIGTGIQVGSHQIHVSVHASNLLDNAYIDHLSTLKPVGYQEMGRNIVFSLKLPMQF